MKKEKGNLFQNTKGTKVKYFMVFEIPHKVYAVLLLHSFGAAGKVVGQWQKHHLTTDYSMSMIGVCLRVQPFKVAV